MIDDVNRVIRESILNAAEKLFAKDGYGGTSLRKITAEAKVNLAAVNYHFGDKESLYREVIIRRLRPCNDRRLAMLETAEREAGDLSVPLVIIFEALARPAFELGQYNADGSHQVVRLLGRSMSDPQPIMAELIAQEVQPVMARFAQAVRRHVPALSPEEFLWHFSFVIGALHHALATMHNMKGLTRSICRDHDGATALGCYIQFSAAAFSSLPTGAK
jgi:AcrR family transcriptional regulator